MNDRRVAIVSPFPPPLGGMAHQANILVRYLEDEGLTVHRVRTNNRRNILPFRDISAWHQFRRLRRHIDVVNIHTCCYSSYFGTAAPIIWWAKRAGLRVVVTYKGGSARDVFRATRECGLRWLRMADLVTVPSGFLRDVFAEFDLPTRIVHNLYETGLSAEAPRAPNTEEPKLVMTRGLGHYYNVDCTIRAFQIVLRSYPRARLLLAGTGNREGHLRKLVSDLAVPNVEFLGQLDRDRMHELYRAGDICVSSSDVDNFPGSLLESFLFGVPIVTTDAGGIPYMVEHGVSARMVPMGDHEAFAREVEYLLEHPEVAREHAEAAQRSIDRYRWDAVRTDWLDALYPPD
jgi:L-malate glycosyltransferase